jgi:hypothetical protein
MLIGTCADLDMRSIRILKHLRPNSPIHLGWNNYKAHKERKTKAYGYDNKEDLYHKLIEKVGEGKKIFITVSAKAEGKVIELFLTDLYPDLKILFIYKETSDDILKHLKVNEEWIKYDIVIITSTITNAVSFNKPYFHCRFDFGIAMGINVRDKLQMGARVRILLDNEIHFWIENKILSFPTTMEQIQQYIEDNIRLANRIAKKYNISNKKLKQLKIDELESHNAQKIVNHPNYKYVLNVYKERIINNDKDVFEWKLKRNIWVDLFLMNQIERNICFKYHIHIYIKQLENKCIDVIIVPSDLSEDEIFIIKNHLKEIRTQLNKDWIDDYDNTDMPCLEEIQLIKNKIKNSVATQEDKEKNIIYYFQKYYKKENVRSLAQREQDKKNGIDIDNFMLIDGELVHKYKHKFTQLLNAKFERDKNINDLGNKEINKFEKRYRDNDKYYFYSNLSQYDAILELNSKLGLKNGADRETVIEWRWIDKEFRQYITNPKNYEKFRERFKLTNLEIKDGKWSFRDLISFIDSIYMKWNNCKLAKIDSSLERIDVYTKEERKKIRQETGKYPSDDRLKRWNYNLLPNPKFEEWDNVVNSMKTDEDIQLEKQQHRKERIIKRKEEHILSNETVHSN